MDRVKNEKAEIQQKLELAGQKIANLERENMKLYKLTIESTPTSSMMMSRAD